MPNSDMPLHECNVCDATVCHLSTQGFINMFDVCFPDTSAVLTAAQYMSLHENKQSE